MKLTKALLTTVLWTTGEALAAEPPPRLLVFLSLDQARGEYLERFDPVLERGLRKLMDAGVVFTETHHEHAATVTAAGHASLATGLFPAHSGIVGNDWFDRTENRKVYCVEDASAPILPVPAKPATGPAGRSPERLLGTALGDWMKGQSPESKVYSIGGKDRSAILMGGKKPDAAFWYDPSTGEWVTSRYYADAYPDWMAELRAAHRADAWRGHVWEPLPVAESLLREMEIEASGAGTEDAGIPKTLAAEASFYRSLFESPFIESYLLELAVRLVREEGLGADDTIDFLALSFSSVDSVGHDYGGNSRELLDAVMRLDRELGAFFGFLDETVGLDRVAFALSSDHGVAPLPEHRLARGLPAGRLSREDFDCWRRAEEGRQSWFLAPLHLDRNGLARQGLEPAAVETELAQALSLCPSVERVWTRSEIEKARLGDGSLDSILELYAHSFHPDRSPDLYLQLRKWHIGRERGTTHGSPYEYDTHVPGIILWPGTKARRVEERIATVDLPVTLAALLGIEPPENVDGVDRSALLR